MTFIVKIDTKGGMDFGSPYNLGRFRQWCKENLGKSLRIEEMKHTRSMSQNKLYWLFLEVIERETGNNSEDLHEYFKRVLLKPKWIKVLENDIRIPGSTTELTKVEFSEYMEKISALTEIPIPDTEKYNEGLDSAPLK